MTFNPGHLAHLALEERLAAVEAKLKDAGARVQTLIREGKQDETRLALATFQFLEVESRTLQRMMEDESFGSP